MHQFTVYKNIIIAIIQIVCLICLFLIPVNLNADGLTVKPIQNISPQEWLTTIDEYETKYADNQNMDAAKRSWQQAALLMPNNAQIQKRLNNITREAEVESTMDTEFNMYFIIKIDPEVGKIAPGFNVNQALDDARIGVGTDFNY